MSVFETLVMVAADIPSPDGTGAAPAPGLPQLDARWWPSQLFWLTITFGFLYWLMAGKFLPAIGAAIEERRNRIADDLDQAAEFRKQAETAEKSYEQALADAKAKAQGIAAETRAEMDQEIETLKAETNAKLEAQLAAADERITAMKADAAAKVREAAVETTQSIVEALIDETPTSEAVSEAVTKASSSISARAA